MRAQGNHGCSNWVFEIFEIERKEEEIDVWNEKRGEMSK
jgi:hypothetical protein